MKGTLLIILMLPIINLLHAQSNPAHIDTSQYVALDASQMPKFPGDSLTKYIKHYIILPNDSCYDQVVVGFTVEENGRLSDIQILSGRCAALDTQVVRCFRSMPYWIAARENDRPISVSLSVPINVEVKTIPKKSIDFSSYSYTLRPSPPAQSSQH